MRIIAGEFRGRKLLPPEGDATRPITDRVKQSLFDVLAPSIDGASVLDLFAGTGSLGLECLSRGATGAVFHEADRSALMRLRENVQSLGVARRAAVVPGDLFQWFAGLGSAAIKSGAIKAAGPDAPGPNGGPAPSQSAPLADLIFLDPPYRFLRERGGELVALCKNLRHACAAQCTIIFRHDAADRLELPALRRYDERDYGGMVIEFLKASAE